MLTQLFGGDARACENYLVGLPQTLVCSEQVAATRLNSLISENMLQISQKSCGRTIKSFMITDQGSFDISTVCCQNVPRSPREAFLKSGPSLRYLLGLIELASEAHEHGYWCISFINLQTPREPPGRAFKRFDQNRQPHSDQKPRHLVTLSPRQGKYAGSLHVRRAQS